ncbi:hypothetical protein AAFF_G00116810 [Aldrovandia affinis]|uniref:Uncharacterized protein n=1 Tax=Aldrovandia affinis TaxID=143900 RepID=A0AAD7T1K8_9TELE|nr:hypothetical protein AAFF_G00116810 [Aldrovandia affinis]
MPDYEGELRVSRTLATVQQGQIPLRVYNPNPYLIEVPESFPLAKVMQGEGLTVEQQHRLTELLQLWSAVFAAHDKDFGWMSVVRHQILTGGVTVHLLG